MTNTTLGEAAPTTTLGDATRSLLPRRGTLSTSDSLSQLTLIAPTYLSNQSWLAIALYVPLQNNLMVMGGAIADCKARNPSFDMLIASHITRSS